MCPNLSLNDPAFVGGRAPAEFTGYVVQVKFQRYSTNFSAKFHAPDTDKVCYVYGASCYDEVIVGTQTSGYVSQFTLLDGVPIPDQDPAMSIWDIFSDREYWGTNSGNKPAYWKLTLVE